MPFGREMGTELSVAGRCYCCILELTIALTIHGKLLTCYLQLSARSSKRIASQLIWSRVVNPTGKEGHNIPVDLYNEHINRTAKDLCTWTRSCEASIMQCGSSLEGMSAVVTNFDRVNSVRPSSSEHTRASTASDINLVLEQLTIKSRVFDYIPRRVHGCNKL